MSPASVVQRVNAPSGRIPRMRKTRPALGSKLPAGTASAVMVDSQLINLFPATRMGPSTRAALRASASAMISSRSGSET